MQKLLLNLAIIILTVSLISSCQKEIINSDAHAQEMAQKERSLEAIKANALQYQTLAEKSQQRTDAKLQVTKQKIEKLKAERSRRFSNPGITLRAGAGVIRVPEDYPTLQEAVDNSQPGGKIHIKGAVSEPGDVLVDVAGLTIQGTGASPTITGSTLLITAEDITVQNLKINMAVVISGTIGAKFMNNNLSATNSVGAVGPFLLINSSNNTIKNCTVNGAYAGGTHEYGLYLDNLSNHNEIENCLSKNTYGNLDGSNSSSAFRIDGADNSLKNCTASNFTRGFSSFGSDCKNNQFIGCVANNSTNDSGFVFFLPDDSNLQFKNCTANSNVNGFFIFGGSCKVSNCTANSNLSLGSLIIFTDVLLEKSTFNNNEGLGIYLFGVNDALISKNNATNNPICDFNQTNCSGNTVTNNGFGTSCTGL